MKVKTKTKEKVVFPDPELEKLYQKMAKAIRESGSHFRID